MKNGNGELVSSVANLVTEALMESLPDSIREKVEKAVAGVSGEVSKLGCAQADLATKIDSLQLLLDEANARYNDLHNELARATHAYEATHERTSKAIPLLIEGGLRAAVEALPKPADGRDGKDGSPGHRGEQGSPGRDAVFTRPIPWTKGRTYSRDAIVAARGGEWIAEIETDQAPGDPCSGWALIHDGVEPVRGELDANGFAVMVYRTASGREYSISLGFRPWQYAGLFDEERDYRVNDVLTEDGGIWIALANSKGKRPGTPDTGSLWRLIQKRPKDGRDGKPGNDGRDGAPGREGHAGVSVLNVELSAGGLLETTLSDGRVLSQYTPFTSNERRAAKRERAT